MSQLASEKEVGESKKRIQEYERRYGVTFAEFEKELLPALDTFQAHEDYNDWFFWETVMTKYTKGG